MEMKYDMKMLTLYEKIVLVFSFIVGSLALFLI